MHRLPACNFQDLIVWQKAHQFVLNVYRLSKQFPREEVYGLTSSFGELRFPSQQILPKDSRRGDDRIKFVS